MKKLLVGLAAVMMASQTAQSQQIERSGVARTNLVSANPIGLLFEWYNGELEHAFSSTASVAVAASIFNEDAFDDNDDIRMGDVIGRYYPAARALRGLSVGLSAGVLSVREATCSSFSCTDERKSSATIGVRGDYVWIIGRDQHFSVATGIGARRILSDKISNDFVPIGRLSLGFAW